MTLGDWLKINVKVCDLMGIYCRVYINEDADYGAIFEGSLDNIPWSLMEYRIGRSEKYDENYGKEPPIFFVDHFVDENGAIERDKPGFIINILNREEKWV